MLPRLGASFRQKVPRLAAYACLEVRCGGGLRLLCPQPSRRLGPLHSARSVDAGPLAAQQHDPAKRALTAPPN